MNTYGIHSINIDTFNLKWHTNYVYPQQARNALVTFLKVHNLTLNILGYMPGSSIVSGCVRIGTGLSMCTVTLAIGERDATQAGMHWYDEALLTGLTQIARGALESLVPCGWFVNASIDAIATINNIRREPSAISTCSGCVQYVSHGPHPDPKYPFPFLLLDLA
jgi:hypothetical protein